MGTTMDGFEAVAGPTMAAQLRMPDVGAMLREIAATASVTLGSDRATCYAYDVRAQTVAAVYTTETDPRRRAYLASSVGRGADSLPIWRMQVESPDPLIVIEDMERAPGLPEGLAARLGTRALVSVRLEHPSVEDRGAPVLLGGLTCSYREPRTLSDEELRRARGLAALASLALATAHLQAAALAGLEAHRTLAAEQAALRRVATEVASDADPARVFARVAREAAGLLDVEAAVVTRFQAEGATVVGSFGGHSHVGSVLPTTGDGALAMVRRSGRQAAIDDYARLAPGSALRAHALALGYQASVAAPVSVGGRLWGAVLATTSRSDGMPAHAGERLGAFADLVALAIANAEARARLVAQAASDPLTGLANNRTFFERLHADSERARRHGRPLALVMIDLDHFKLVNDRHGHIVGDQVLVELARRLRALTRVEDTLARVGGEEFAWLLPETGLDSAVVAAERARHAVADRPFGEAGPLTMSAGVAELDASMATNDLFRAADAALYAAKERGRNLCATWPLDEESGRDAA